MPHKSGKAAYPSKPRHPGKPPKGKHPMPNSTMMSNKDAMMAAVPPPKVARPAAKRKKK